MTVALAIVLGYDTSAGNGIHPLSLTSVPPMVAKTLTPLLADWIVSSRDAAIAQGVKRIPDAIREAVAGYVPDDILDRVRWRTGGSGEMSLQQSAFTFGEVPAITLDHVVVFADAAGANDPKLWVHELRHVMQFADWGVAGFAERYLLDSASIENEAAEYRWRYMKLKGLVPVTTSLPTPPQPAG